MMVALKQAIMRPMTTAKLRAHLQRTLKRALEMGLTAKVERVEHGLYLVPSTSRSGTVHTVTGTGLPLDCTCEARWHMPLCVHRAAVLVRRWEAEGKTVRLNDKGDVVVVTQQDAADLAYPIPAFPALVPDAPPPPAYAGGGDDDRPLILEDI